MTTQRDLIRVSRFLSYVLRHRPESIGLRLDAEGWGSIAELLERAGVAGTPLSRDVLLRVVRENDKQRFRISEDGERIRANQGHSVAVDLGLAPEVPPETLFHGTAARNRESILRDGLVRGGRQHVHLSLDEATARGVGQRHGPAIVLTVRAGEMHRARFEFFLSANGVWLTEHVPATFIDVPDDGG